MRMPELSGVDWAFVRDGSAVAIAEIKRRAGLMHDYPTLMLSATKASVIRAIAKSLAVRPLLVIAWRDHTGWIDISELRGEVRFGGRRDRGDELDSEPCEFFPVDLFRRLNGGNQADAC